MPPSKTDLSLTLAPAAAGGIDEAGDGGAAASSACIDGKDVRLFPLPTATASRRTASADETLTLGTAPRLQHPPRAPMAERA